MGEKWLIVTNSSSDPNIMANNINFILRSEYNFLFDILSYHHNFYIEWHSTEGSVTGFEPAQWFYLNVCIMDGI